MGPRAGLSTVLERKVSATARNQSTIGRSSSPQPVTMPIKLPGSHLLLLGQPIHTSIRSDIYK